MTTQLCKTCGFILIDSRKKCPNCGQILGCDEPKKIWPKKNIQVFQNKKTQNPSSNLQPER